jgi:hypothetical protein
MNRVEKQAGFTVIELVVVMTVSTIIVGSLIGAVALFISNVALTNTRNGIPVDLQAGLQKIATIIRNSDNVLLYNLTPDVNAPLAKVGEAANVPGPPSDPTDNDYRYFWRSTTNQLILSQPSRDASNQPIYTDPTNGDFTGPRDSIILYGRGTALYERIVYSTQSVSSTLTCSDTSQIGGCTTDIKLVDNIKVVNGVPQFSVTYLDSAGVAIPATLPNGTSNYNARKLTKAIKVDLTLEATVGTRKVTSHDTSTISFRNGYAPGSIVIGSTSAAVGTGATAPPWSMAGNMYVGPGGLSLGSLTNVTGVGLNVIGRIGLSGFSQIGNASSPMTLTVGNLACGTPPNWPTLCGTQPISGLGNLGTSIYGTICATGQTTTSYTYSTGVKVGCVAPAITMPTYDRQTFIDSMKSSRPSNTGSCDLTNFTPKTLGPDVVYTGSLTFNYLFCQIDLKGNIYVMGDFVSSNALNFRVDDSVGTKRPIVLVDGNIAFTSLLESIVPNSYGTGVDFISFGSANANCLTIPACRDRTDPTYLYNSYNKPTISIGPISAPGSTFYSYYGAVSVGTFATTGAVSGQTVSVNSATVSGN